jgi:hypothetical protein
MLTRVFFSPWLTPCFNQKPGRSNQSDIMIHFGMLGYISSALCMDRNQMIFFSFGTLMSESKCVHRLVKFKVSACIIFILTYLLYKRYYIVGHTDNLYLIIAP